MKKGIAILPLVGAINADRAELLLDELVSKLPSYSLHHLIIDVSGIHDINEDTAAFLDRLVKMLELFGIHPICTGLRPDLARSLVHSIKGSTWNSIPTLASVQQALTYLGH